MCPPKGPSENIWGDVVHHVKIKNSSNVEFYSKTTQRNKKIYFLVHSLSLWFSEQRNKFRLPQFPISIANKDAVTADFVFTNAFKLSA